ncbi:MAG TPA: serine/threonine-protein kinase, partial [Myxococcota bacterium]
MTTLPRTIGPYRLEQKLGAGGMGVVYRAVDTSLDRVVAIKMMHARELMGDDVDLGEVQTRFLREAKAAARIKSRHVAQVLQLGTTDEGEAYIVMELLHGTALSRVMSKQGALAPTRVVHIASQICRGMQSAHDLGVVHRDLKPANVMLIEEEGDHDFVKILDFGVAKLTDDNGGQGLTQTGALLGTLPFMAPEQIGGGAVDARTDIYALGILLYRMFTGMTVWDADSLGDIVRHQLSSTPPSMFERVTNAKFTPALDAVVLTCLAKDPAHRYQSMKLLRVALDEALHAPATPHGSPALARTFNDADDPDDDRVDTLEVVPGQGGRVRSVDVRDAREHGTSPTGNIPKERLDKDGLPKPIAGNDSGDVGVFRDDTLVASATAAAVISSSSSSLPSSLPSPLLSSSNEATNASSLTVPSRPKQPLPTSAP